LLESETEFDTVIGISGNCIKTESKDKGHEYAKGIGCIGIDKEGAIGDCGDCNDYAIETEEIGACLCHTDDVL